MTLRIDRIEIREQPERKRYWAEIEVHCQSGFRVKRLTTPQEDGRDGIFDAVQAYLDELDPPAPEWAGAPEWSESAAVAPLGVPNNKGDPAEWYAVYDESGPVADRLDVLRAEAEAAGVRVDRRWGEARLRQEIASAGHAGARDAV